MKRKSKYQRRHQKSRDCTKCKNFIGFVSKNYFACEAEMYEDQEYPKCHNIYDRDVLKKGTCVLFVPLEVDQDDRIHDNDALDRPVEEIVKDLFGEQ